MKVKIGKKKKLLGVIPFQAAAFGALVLVLALGSALSQELYREYKIRKEISDLKSQIQSMEKDNYQLSQLIDYYQTDQYKEAEARKRLGLKADGEKVVMVDQGQAGAQEMQNQAAQQTNLPNRIKWWNYFFASRA